MFKYKIFHKKNNEHELKTICDKVFALFLVVVVISFFSPVAAFSSILDRELFVGDVAIAKYIIIIIIGDRNALTCERALASTNVLFDVDCVKWITDSTRDDAQQQQQNREATAKHIARYKQEISLTSLKCLFRIGWHALPSSRSIVGILASSLPMWSSQPTFFWHLQLEMRSVASLSLSAHTHVRC